MLSRIRRWFRRDNASQMVSALLAEVSNREELLGMKAPIIPTPEGIKVDAAKIAKYSDTDGYKKFAEEAWSQVIQGLDKILDDRSSNETRQYYCGSVKATLDMLRVSYKAKMFVEEFLKEQSASLRRLPPKQG